MSDHCGIRSERGCSAITKTSRSPLRVPGSNRSAGIPWSGDTQEQLNERVNDRLTDSAVHGSVQYRPITRHDVVGGYINLRGLDELADALKEGT